MKKILPLIILSIVFLGCTKVDREERGSDLTKTDEKIEFYSKKIEQDPGAYAYYNNLSHAYMEKARATGDHNYHHMAKSTVAKSLEISPNNYVGLVYISMANMAEHNFTEALEYSQTAIELYPDQSHAFGVLGDAYLELGEFEKAQQAYIKMKELKPDLYSWSRISNANLKKGDMKAAVRAMERAYEAGIKDVRTSKENLAWTQTMIGIIYLDNGNPHKAEGFFKKALEILPEYFLAQEHLQEVKNHSLLHDHG